MNVYGSFYVLNSDVHDMDCKQFQERYEMLSHPGYELFTSSSSSDIARRAHLHDAGPER